MYAAVFIRIYEIFFSRKAAYRQSETPNFGIGIIVFKFFEHFGIRVGKHAQIFARTRIDGRSAHTPIVYTHKYHDNVGQNTAFIKRTRALVAASIGLNFIGRTPGNRTARERIIDKQFAAQSVYYPAPPGIGVKQNARRNFLPERVENRIIGLGKALERAYESPSTEKYLPLYLPSIITPLLKRISAKIYRPQGDKFIYDYMRYGGKSQYLILKKQGAKAKNSIKFLKNNPNKICIFSKSMLKWAGNNE